MSDRVYVSTRQFPLTREHLEYLQECAVSGSRKLELVFRAPEEMTPGDLDQVTATINFFPPAMLSRAKHLEWVQLASAGAVKFSLLDVQGRVVRSFDLGNRAAGAYSEALDAGAIARGRYVGVLQVNGRVAGKTLMLKR